MYFSIQNSGKMYVKSETFSNHYTLCIRESIFVSLSVCCGSRTSLNLELNLKTFNTLALNSNENLQLQVNKTHIQVIKQAYTYYKYKQDKPLT